MAFNARALIGCSLFSSVTGAAACYWTVSHAAPSSPPHHEALVDAQVNAPNRSLTTADNPSASLTLAAIDNLRTDLLAKIEEKSKGGASSIATEALQEARAADRSAAGEQADAAVRAAIRAGVWQEQDRDTLRATLGKLDDETCLAVQRELATAINEHRIKLAYGGPPW